MYNQATKIVCVGRSYAEHAQELGNAIPEQALLFMKPASSVASVQQGITWNKALGECHYECELCLRIDQPLPQIMDKKHVLQSIGAVTLGLDLTLRDVQQQLKAQGHPWERAKAFAGACILGDWVDVADVVQDWRDIHFEFLIDNESRQIGDTALMLFDIADLLIDIHHAFHLNVGDVIMTGTPKGVGALKSGQKLTMKLHGLSQDYIWQTDVK